MPFRFNSSLATIWGPRFLLERTTATGLGWKVTPRRLELHAGFAYLPHFHRDPFVGAAMMLVVVAAAVRDEIERAAVPVSKALGAELLRRVLDPRVVIGPVQVEQHAPPPSESIASPFELLTDPSDDERKEWIQPSHLLHEPLELPHVT